MLGVQTGGWNELKHNRGFDPNHGDVDFHQHLGLLPAFSTAGRMSSVSRVCATTGQLRLACEASLIYKHNELACFEFAVCCTSTAIFLIIFVHLHHGHYPPWGEHERGKTWKNGPVLHAVRALKPGRARRLFMTEETSPTGSSWKIDEILVHRNQPTLSVEPEGLGILEDRISWN